MDFIHSMAYIKMITITLLIYFISAAYRPLVVAKVPERFIGTNRRYQKQGGSTSVG